MHINYYQEQAERTLTSDNTTHSGTLAVLALGLCGEAGEVAEHIKKALAHGKELKLADLKAELGDVLWYLSAIASTINADLETVARMNLLKLELRYPDGFPTYESTIDKHNTPVED